jgi:hypothetical protein
MPAKASRTKLPAEDCAALAKLGADGAVLRKKAQTPSRQENQP